MSILLTLRSYVLLAPLPLLLMSTPRYLSAGESELIGKGIRYSNVTNGLYVFVSSDSDANLSNARIFYGFESTNSKPITILVPKRTEELFRVELMHSDGTVAKKTALGRQAGSKFLNMPDKPNLSHVRRTQPVGVFALPAPAEFFEVPKPGNYVLTIQFQLYVVVDSKQLKLIRFSEIEYPVKFEDEAVIKKNPQIGVRDRKSK